MWGGGMMFPRIVVQEEACRILNDFDINYKEYEKGYFVANSIESTAKLTSKAISSGAEIFNLMEAVDVMIRENDVIAGLVINWTAVSITNLHVDPMTIRSKIVFDGNGHDSYICKIIQKKIPGAKINVIGEKPMWVDVGERDIIEATKEVYPGLFVLGMAANAVAGKPRMGPIFGGMLLSSEKAVKLAISKLIK